MPKATVVLPVFNAELFLPEAIESILCQSFSDFELRLLDDGSNDGSLEVMHHYANRDSRIKISQNDGNRGIVFTLNRGINEASGEYIIRMDADDICLPNRFEKQIQFLERNPSVIVMGSAYTMFGSRSELVQLPASDPEIKAELCFRCVLAHPTVVIRRSILQFNNIQYSVADLHAEDYGLWTNLAEFGAFYNFNEPLLRYRWHSDNISVAHKKKQAATADLVRNRYIRNALCISDSYCVQIHSEIVNGQFCQSEIWIDDAVTWLETIVNINRSKHVFTLHIFEQWIDYYILEMIYFLRRVKSPIPARLRKLKRDLVCNQGWLNKVRSMIIP